MDMICAHTPHSPRSLPSSTSQTGKPLTFHGVHHVALICSNLEASMAFYQGVLGEFSSQHYSDGWTAA